MSLVTPLPRSGIAIRVAVPNVVGLEANEATQAAMMASTSTTQQPSIVPNSSASIGFKQGPSSTKDFLPMTFTQLNAIDLVEDGPVRTKDESP